MKRTTAQASERAPEGQQLKKKAKKSKKASLPVTAADIAPPSSHYEVMLNRGVAGLNSMAEFEGNYLTREQVDNVWKACVRSQRKDPQLIQDDMEIVSVESIKGIGCKELFVCVIGDFIVLPGPVWVGMKMTTALKGRMTSTRHVTSFHNAVTAIQDDGFFTDKTAVVLLRGGPDAQVGDKLKQTGIALCTNSGAKLLTEYGMKLQRAL